MRFSIGVTALLCAVTLTGCGSSGGYVSDARTAIDTMNSAVSTYNNTNPGDVQSTGTACNAALDKLNGTSMPAPKSAPKGRKQLAIALQNAYVVAKRGFGDCAAAGARNDYMRMAQAAQEIDAANVWLNRARALDR